MITVGIDEVGRGCWAGPLVAGAVILHTPIAGLKDSKKLSKPQREKLAERIHASDAVIGVGWVSAPEVDGLGLAIAVKLAMQRALEQITATYDKIIIDGNINYFPEDTRVEVLVKADDLIPEVSAASIVAKVARDNYMANIAHKKYPEYAFDQHVGYGTSLHQQMLKLYGVSDLHRMSFRPIQAIMSSAA